MEESRKWFKEAGFGMMVHFGLYSVPAGEWKGKRMGGTIGEWIQSYFRIPNAEYHELAKVFNPIYFNAEEWIKLAKDAGMKYFVITSKHHEGFALFKSEADKFNSYHASPCGRDIIAECAEACYKHGIKLGLYYSQEIDWTHRHGGGYGAAHPNVEGMSWCNDWDFPGDGKKDYGICFEEKIKPQVKEILTGYGDICLIWFDTPWDITAEQSMELYNMVKEYQPKCLVNSRIGNGVGDYGSAGDNEIPDDYKEMLYETPATLNDTWGFKYYDNNWKNADKVKEIKQHLNERGVNYLLNVGPDHLGRIPGPAIDVLRKVGTPQS